MQVEKLQVPEAWKNVLQAVETWAQIKSPWILHYNSGSCNGCDIELLASITPRYDVERLGLRLQASPRHADILIVTGPVTKQSRDRLKRIYEQMPNPKYVIAMGTCALSGGVFAGCYNVIGHVDEVIPVDVYIAGCPPRPEALIQGITTLLEKLKGQHNDSA
jgi:membrane-bound hydrogenase subunit mbhJ